MLLKRTGAIQGLPQKLLVIRTRPLQSVANLDGSKNASGSIGTQSRGVSAMPVAAAGSVPEAPEHTNLVREFAQLRSQNQHFRAFDALDVAQQELRKLASVSGPTFSTLWQQLTQLAHDSTVYRQLDEQMLKIAALRVNTLAEKGKYGRDRSSGAADIWSMIKMADAWASQSQEPLQVAQAKKLFWNAIEHRLSSYVVCLPEQWGDYAMDIIPDESFKVHLRQAAADMAAAVASFDQARPQLMQCLLEASIAKMGAYGLEQHGWLLDMADREGVPQIRVTDAVLASAVQCRKRDALLQLDLQHIEPNLAEKLCRKLADAIVADADELSRSYVTGQIAGDYGAYGSHANYAPLEHVHMLPALAAGLPQAPQAGVILADAVKSAVEALCRRGFGEYITAPIQRNYAAWLFATGLQPDVEDEADLRLIAAGLQNHDHYDGWSWDASTSERADVFKRLQKLATEKQWQVSIVHGAWDKMHMRALEGAESALEKAQKRLATAEYAHKLRQAEVEKLACALNEINQATL